MNYTSRVFRYDAVCWPLAQEVTKHFGQFLCTLHADIPRLEVGKDQQTEFHQHFYKIGDDFWSLYRQFVRDVACPMFEAEPSDIIYQRRPTFRVHLPGNVATGGWHRDGDYNHPLEEINFVVPLTDFLGPADGHAGNGFFIEDGIDCWRTPRMTVGQALRFHGAKLMHGSVENRTGQTRVSLDFRLLPKAALRDFNKSTVNQGIPFKVGPDGYYAEL